MISNSGYTSSTVVGNLYATTALTSSRNEITSSNVSSSTTNIGMLSTTALTCTTMIDSTTTTITNILKK